MLLGLARAVVPVIISYDLVSSTDLVLSRVSWQAWAGLQGQLRLPRPTGPVRPCKFGALPCKA